MKIYLLKKDRKSFKEWIEKTKCDPYSIELMEKKTFYYIIFFKDAKIEFANILKQTALSVGCDCSIGRDVISGKTDKSDILLAASKSQILKMREKLKGQPFSLEKSMDFIVDRIEFKDSFFVDGTDLLEKKKFLIMGILNVTPDSFYDGGKYNNVENALKRVEEMIQEGADIIDIGGQSTRPFSEPVSVDEEMERVLSVVENIVKRFPDLILSVDTYNSKTAYNALSLGVKIVNDISGLSFDPNMGEVISKKKASLILMHIKGTPKDMQVNPTYDDLLIEIVDYLEERINKALTYGIDPLKISVDPGIGFGKSVEDNLKIVNNLEIFSTLKKSITLGVSNKSFIGKVLNREKHERVYGTVGANICGLMNGAKIFRVHNVKENYDALKIASEVLCH
ncbi:MAG: dihydropteroate synthase [bacterium]|uniref:Dihydropteroate synthase n=2 Tax=Bacteria candidate phyla TaxID=1783234 RepID=A0A101I1Q5_UNCT6|nr:MAG: Dihydropteroate synthase [candidate division TA06 bacterium 32_111]KUK86789.1 MAG: Dihydropteroate synthase [candidate division TA06 bacterium 34_109]MDI6700241.1 dihydropteroate synthase [bacterium]HAF08352.1 dihydropteroate synthase [candidate division WOR-3 bacterium]HCP16579.1 dihydropteroate synthase [candidate division WOR-3 bacterium]